MPFKSRKQFVYLKMRKPKVFETYLEHEGKPEPAVANRLIGEKMARRKR